MTVLIVNPIIYTSETADIKRAASIKDTMIYDLCLAFLDAGHEVTLVAGEPFKPTKNEDYPFEVIWAKCAAQKICKPNVLPYCPELKRIIKNESYDLIISSEVFSLNSLLLARRRKNGIIIWHELAKHNRLLHKLPSKFWYNIIARIFFRNILVVPRSEEAKGFISKYCGNVSDTVIDHGVNLGKFKPRTEKESFFIIPSQLIARKQIDLSIAAFADFAEEHGDYSLYIFGDGEEADKLKAFAEISGVANKVKFFGKTPHETLKEYLARAKAMLVYTRKDNNMVSVVEAISCGTPVVTTSVPYNAAYIKSERLGIVNDKWGKAELEEIVNNNEIYINNCLSYRHELSNDRRVEQFMELI